jgi:hypothetical protein
MELALAQGGVVLGGGRWRIGQMVRFQQTLRRLAMTGERFVECGAGPGSGGAAASVLEPSSAALLYVGALVAIGSPAVCLEWSYRGIAIEGGAG